MENIFKPPAQFNFNGNLSENWRRFKQLYDIYMKATGYDKKSSDVQVAILLNLMGEEAIELFGTMTLAADDRKNVTKVLEISDEYCNPRKNIVYERYLFYNRNQKENEPFDHFLKDLSTLIKNCEFDTQTDSMLRDRIVLGVYDTEIQKNRLKTKDLDLKQVGS